MARQNLMAHKLMHGGAQVSAVFCSRIVSLAKMEEPRIATIIVTISLRVTILMINSGEGLPVRYFCSAA